MYKSLERHASSVYTREVFLLFPPSLLSATTLKIDSDRETATSTIYTLYMFGDDVLERERHVCVIGGIREMNCSCIKMELMGLLDDHMPTVLFHLNILDLPECIVKKRWTVYAKKSMLGGHEMTLTVWTQCSWVGVQDWRMCVGRFAS
jgi:hypothetical protein